MRWKRATKPLEVDKIRLNEFDELVLDHFQRLSDVNHINRAGLTLALRRLGSSPSLIVETGSSAWGTDSSRLFDSYVRRFGGFFYTVDIREEAQQALASSLGPSSRTFVSDSIEFLQKLELPIGFDKIDLLYLDSFDLDTGFPEPAMNHGLREFEAAEKFLGEGSIVVIDDTPVDPCLLDARATTYFEERGIVPGKGSLVLNYVDSKKYKIIYQHYNVVLVKVS